MAPPGRPNMTSVCSISKLFIRACAPLSCIRASLSSGPRSGSGWKQNDLPKGRSFDAHVVRRARQVITTRPKKAAPGAAPGIAVPLSATAIERNTATACPASANGELPGTGPPALVQTSALTGRR